MHRAIPAVRAPRSRRQTILFVSGALLLGLAGGIFLAELAARVVLVTPGNEELVSTFERSHWRRAVTHRDDEVGCHDAVRENLLPGILIDQTTFASTSLPRKHAA